MRRGDVTACVVSAGSKDEVTQAAVKAIKEAEEEEKREELRARKLAKKAAFDSAYDDDGGARALDDGAQDGGDEGDDVDPGQDDAKKKRKGLGWARCSHACAWHPVRDVHAFRCIITPVLFITLLAALKKAKRSKLRHASETQCGRSLTEPHAVLLCICVGCCVVMI